MISDMSFLVDFRTERAAVRSRKNTGGYVDSRFFHNLTYCWIKRYFHTVGCYTDAHAGPSLRFTGRSFRLVLYRGCLEWPIWPSSRHWRQVMLGMSAQNDTVIHNAFSDNTLYDHRKVSQGHSVVSDCTLR